MGRKIARAVEVTEQQAMRIPNIWEDTVTMAAHAAQQVLGAHNDAPEKLRYLLCGTETGVDCSKALAAYLLGLLQKADIPIPMTISTAQVQHACAGGTVALLSIAALLMCSETDDYGLIVCSDIAHYEAPSTAEVTQGAGAVAMLVRRYPRLLELDVAHAGYASEDVDDFFRPLGSQTAVVKGPYSVHCYNRAMRFAFNDHCRRRGKQARDVLDTADIIALHTPFPSMAGKALHNLLAKETDMSPQEIKMYINARGIDKAMEYMRVIGNIYSGSVYLMLYLLLYHRYRQCGEDIVGREALICSYGSGYTMAVISGTIAESAPQIIEAWNIEELMRANSTIDYAQYEQWIRHPYAIHGDDLASHPECQPIQGDFYLHAIREDGYREYAIKK